MKFRVAIDLYVRDMWASGRFTSKRSEVSYRACLNRHADDVGNRDPRYVGRDDVKKTLAHWTKPNTQRVNRSALMSFYRWTVEEDIRTTNPVEQTRRPRRQPSNRYRLTADECTRVLTAASTPRERRAIFLAACAGLRNQELRGLQGRHFERPDYIWVSADIAKGSHERNVPVIRELRPVVDEIRRNVAPDKYVLPAQRIADPGINRERFDLATQPSSRQALIELVAQVGERAGIAARITPHTLRHAYADRIVRHADMRIAQEVLGHKTIATTEIYIGRPTLDEVSASLGGVDFGLPERTPVLGVLQTPNTPLEATTGIEPV